MISGNTNKSGFKQILYGVADDVLSSSSLQDHTSSSNEDNKCQSNAFLYGFSVLKDKVHQVQTLVDVAVLSQDQGVIQQPVESVSMAIAGIGTLLQEIIVNASSMMFTCQQLALTTESNINSSYVAGMGSNDVHQLWRVHKVDDEVVGLPPTQLSDPHPSHVQIGSENGRDSSFFSDEHLEWYGDNYNNYNTINVHDDITTTSKKVVVEEMRLLNEVEKKEVRTDGYSPTNYELIELDAADLLAKYTHYCQICGKGFKRDANLRMHMRAHGEEYESTAALSNPMKSRNSNSMESNAECYSKLVPIRKYSCPQEGCRWNKKHAKFQPLKSMICVKNHYKRSHCPKMYVCNRCNQKQFSVLSDLRTHEKHCGDLKWQCSCGTTFSRKDKLIGHCALFFGHTPAGNTSTKQEKFELHTEQ
ncbi:hypothetical protein C5167_033700 [Papaver somniferum]|uniref:C2H2-type domain-containing protein n=1 Tax=Papaver somniferum TaxID=3469 RepID=A0A4Y7KB36_PAPSO|nr:protein SENSITIVE TO PROTON RHIZOTOXICITY 2-like [Papaver somniferum]RZC70573.1 hypothetical protein C5167_033700 [Papaver somniferum]